MGGNIKTSLGVAIIIIFAATIGFFTWKFIDASNNVSTVSSPQNTNSQLNNCTKELKTCPDGTSVSRTGTNCEFAACPKITGITKKIIVASPKENAEIESPVSVSGKVSGTWFSEGSFPVEIYADNNKLLSSWKVEFTPKSKNDTWMTENLVDFKDEIPFSEPGIDSGYILFRKDNLSGKHELDEQFRLPVKFKEATPAATPVSGLKTYRNEEYGFEFDYFGFMYKEFQDKEGWPHSIVMLVPTTHQAQSYELAVEVWNKESDFWKEYPLVNSGNARVIKVKNNKYISLWNNNGDEEIDKCLQSLKVIE
jgi:hypothetical protein